MNGAIISDQLGKYNVLSTRIIAHLHLHNGHVPSTLLLLVSGECCEEHVLSTLPAQRVAVLAICLVGLREAEGTQ